MGLLHCARPLVPWRAEPALTECGRPILPRTALADPGTALRVVRERQLAGARWREASAGYCNHCLEGLNSWHHHRDSPMMILLREFERVRYSGEKRARGRERVAAELAAIITLIERHRGEFDDLVDGESVLAALAR